MGNRSVWLIPLLVAVPDLGPTATAQTCALQFTRDYPNLHFGSNGFVRAFHLFDLDGPGPAGMSLVLGGSFSSLEGLPAHNIAAWDGQDVELLGEGLLGTVAVLATFDDDGPGPNPPVLVAAGSLVASGSTPLNNIAMWSGAEWLALGSGLDGVVRGLAEFDEDGSGPNPPRLFACGDFTTAGGVPAMHIARWDGVEWSDVDGGLGIPAARVNALAVFDADNAGPGEPFLVAGGQFQATERNPGAFLARWDGASWSDVGNPLSGSSEVFGLTVFDDDGEGPHLPELYACGQWYLTLDFKTIARWDGLTWRGVGRVHGTAQGFTVFDVDDGDGLPAELFVYGSLSGADVQRWNGTRLQELRTDIFRSTPEEAIGWDPDGPGGIPPSLFVASRADRIVRWGCGFVAPDTCIGDMTGDRVVGLIDLIAFLDGFGQRTSATQQDGDFDFDSDVDIQDLALLLGHFGDNCGPL